MNDLWPSALLYSLRNGNPFEANHLGLWWCTQGFSWRSLIFWYVCKLRRISEQHVGVQWCSKRMRKNGATLQLSSWFFKTNIYLLLLHWSKLGSIDSSLPTCGGTLLRENEGKSISLICPKTALFSASAKWDSSTFPLITLSVLADNLKEEFRF